MAELVVLAFLGFLLKAFEFVQTVLLITQAPQYLEDFEFNRNVSTLSIFKAPYTTTEAATRKTATLDITSFNPEVFQEVQVISV